MVVLVCYSSAADWPADYTINLQVAQWVVRTIVFRTASVFLITPATIYESIPDQCGALDQTNNLPLDFPEERKLEAAVLVHYCE